MKTYIDLNEWKTAARAMGFRIVQMSGKHTTFWIAANSAGGVRGYYNPSLGGGRLK